MVNRRRGVGVSRTTTRNTVPRSGQPRCGVGVNRHGDDRDRHGDDNGDNSTRTGDHNHHAFYYKRRRMKCMHSVFKVRSIPLNNCKLI